MKTIAVLTPYKRAFNVYVCENPNKDAEFINISKMDDLRGRKFNSVVLGHHHERLGSSIIYSAKRRVITIIPNPKLPLPMYKLYEGLTDTKPPH